MVGGVLTCADTGPAVIMESMLCCAKAEWAFTPLRSRV